MKWVIDELNELSFQVITIFPINLSNESNECCISALTSIISCTIVTQWVQLKKLSRES